MFSTGHLLWIAISLILITGGLIYLRIRTPRFEEMLKICFILGIISEVVKIFSVANLLPVVDPVITSGAAGPAISYVPRGQYSPYIESSHLPFELCSLQMVFYAIIIWVDNPKWRKRFTSIIFVTGFIGGFMGIALSYITNDFVTVRDYFTSPRVWQYFLYHSMVVVVGIYAGFGKNSPVTFSDIKSVTAALISLDFISLYLNSVFSVPVFIDEKPAALLYRVNYFSSYVNPFNLVLTEKWQWILYLIIRFVSAFTLILLLFLLQKAVRKKEA
ncbi:MAG: YwaF family protein [Lachnospiraceae bacterium]|nr:YwaF family protein [Lachnospiraceae bacterium]